MGRALATGVIPSTVSGRRKPQRTSRPHYCSQELMSSVLPSFIPSLFLPVCSLISFPILVKHGGKKLVGIQQNSEHRVGVECVAPSLSPVEPQLAYGAFPICSASDQLSSVTPVRPPAQRRLLHLARQCLGRVQ